VRFPDCGETAATAGALAKVAALAVVAGFTLPAAPARTPTSGKAIAAAATTSTTINIALFTVIFSSP
jgi:hypothetical protein